MYRGRLRFFFSCGRVLRPFHVSLSLFFLFPLSTALLPHPHGRAHLHVSGISAGTISLQSRLRIRGSFVAEKIGEGGSFAIRCCYARLLHRIHGETRQRHKGTIQHVADDFHTRASASSLAHASGVSLVLFHGEISNPQSPLIHPQVVP